MTTLKDEYSEVPVQCPKCKKMATSVFKTGNKIFYNHGNPKATFKNGELDMSWKSCEDDRPTT